MKKITVIPLFLLFVGLSFASTYSGGTGEPNDPYQIATKADLLSLAADTNDYAKCFILTADVNMTGQVFTTAIIAADTSSSGDFQGTAFAGTFDGNGHKITNFTINGGENDYIGLFGIVDYFGGSARNLGLDNFAISGDSCVGGLVGYNYYGTLTDCYATGSVSGNSAVGGLVGYNYYGTLTDCYATGSVSGTDPVGGLMGYNYYGTLTDCYATGQVSGVSFVGGLVGRNTFVGGIAGENDGTITASYATGAVSGNSSVGGLVGSNEGALTSCYATGSVSGGSAGGNVAGGLVGDNFGMITSCYATGVVSGTLWVGGLMGLNGGTLTACYSTGSVIGSDTVGGLVGWNQGPITASYATGTVSGISLVGGLVGENDGHITACYATGAVSGYTAVGGLVGWNSYTGSVSGSFWDTSTSGIIDPEQGMPDTDGMIGLPTAQMQVQSTFSEWDFSDTDGDPADWMMLREGEDYPRLKWQQIIPGDIAGLYGVNFVDYAEIAAHWGQTGCPTGCENADINNDGTVDIDDLMSLADNWLLGT